MLLVNHTPWSVVVWNHYDSPLWFSRFSDPSGSHSLCLSTGGEISRSLTYLWVLRVDSLRCHPWFPSERNLFLVRNFTCVPIMLLGNFFTLWRSHHFPYVFPHIFPWFSHLFLWLSHVFFGKKIRPDHTTESDWFISLEKRCLRSGAIPF
jgi:hypothetical protein